MTPTTTTMMTLRLFWGSTLLLLRLLLPPLLPVCRATMTTRTHVWLVYFLHTLFFCPEPACLPISLLLVKELHGFSTSKGLAERLPLQEVIWELAQQGNQSSDKAAKRCAKGTLHAPPAPSTALKWHSSDTHSHESYIAYAYSCFLGIVPVTQYSTTGQLPKTCKRHVYLANEVVEVGNKSAWSQCFGEFIDIKSCHWAVDSFETKQWS